MTTTMRNISDVVPDSFVVVLKDRDSIQALEDRINGVDDSAAKLLTTYKTVPACCATLSDDTRQQFESDNSVAYIEQVRVVGLGLPDDSVQTTTAQPDDDDLWGLNRVCERVLDVKRAYHAPATGKGITAYVVGTGVYTEHQDFNGRASWGNNFVDFENTDEYGHGTHVAGTIGGTT
ncbi:hypothetical protein BGZ82_003516, partial [Podila clonocystis]